MALRRAGDCERVAGRAGSRLPAWRARLAALAGEVHRSLRGRRGLGEISHMEIRVHETDEGGRMHVDLSAPLRIADRLLQHGDPLDPSEQRVGMPECCVRARQVHGHLRRPADREHTIQPLDGAGEIGVIASVTQPFCGGCTRARLSADGSLYTCLFATQAVDLRGLLRAGASDDVIAAAVAGTWTKRADRYSELRTGETGGLARIEMSYIGG